MSEPVVSVVIPAFEAEATIASTIDALLVAADRAGAAIEVVLVDDGSRDRTAAVAQEAAAGRVALTIIRQVNAGRFAARRAGLDAARAQWVLLLDSRVQIAPDALSFVLEQASGGARVWTSHVHVRGTGALARFWALLAELAWSDYFERPRTIAFGVEDFDRYPKGTTCFFAPRAVLVDAVASFRTAYADTRDANDDTPVIRWIAEREPIHVSPSFACAYEPRTTLLSFLRHSVHRGVVFVDGHVRRGSRFRPAAIAFFPSSALVAWWALRRPRRVAFVVAAVSGGLGSLGLRRRRSAADLRALAIVGPLYAFAHGLGMWKGAVLALVARLRRSPPNEASISGR